MKSFFRGLIDRLSSSSGADSEDADMSPVTTGGGDDGRSSLFSGERHFKDTSVFEALGDIDELNSWIGLVRTREGVEPYTPFLHEIQIRLGRILATVATAPASALFSQLQHVTEVDAAMLEDAQKRLKEEVEIPARFIVPGEVEGIGEIDVARAITRRCERRVVHLIRELGRPDDEIRRAQVFLNRLSDYLFVLGRAVEQQMQAS
ncbi:MAG: cob(I)yrinic acid a,c-diamide adenosyltransferase [Spirochaetota bacterium]